MKLGRNVMTASNERHQCKKAVLVPRKFGLSGGMGNVAAMVNFVLQREKTPQKTRLQTATVVKKKAEKSSSIGS